MHWDARVLSGRMSVLALLSAVAIGAAGCAPSVLVPCRELQHLKLGMSKAEVIARLGAPVQEYPLDGASGQVRRDVDWGLNYSQPGWDGVAWDGVRLRLEFAKDQLVHVSSFRKVPFSTGIEESLFRLERGQPPYVGPNFEQYLCVTSY